MLMECAVNISRFFDMTVLTDTADGKTSSCCVANTINKYRGMVIKLEVSDLQNQMHILIEFTYVENAGTNS